MARVHRFLGVAAAAAAVTATVAAGGVAFAAPASADVGVNVCSLGADPPNSSNDGTGSRTGCSGTVTLTVLVKKDVFGPDPTAGERVVSGFGNGTLTANGNCSHGRGSYYTETRSSTGNKVQSGRVTRC